MKSAEIQKYPGHYLIYARKSTDDPNNQKNSITYQKSEIIRFAKSRLLPIAPIDIPGFCTAGIIGERHTAFKENEYFTINEKREYTYRIERPKFARLSHLLSERKFKGVIFLCYDRASRNENDDNILNKLSNIGIDIQYVQVTYEDNSAGKFHRSVDAAVAQQYSRIISDKVRSANKHLREQGICIYSAPIGYINNGNSRERPIDPKRGSIIKSLFELYATGDYSVTDLARVASDQGLTMRPMRRKRTLEESLIDEENTIEATERPVSSCTIHRILTNRFYIGYMKNIDGTYIKSQSHEALVSEQLFETVQELLASKCVSKKYPKKIPYSYRGLLRCLSCNRVYTPYLKKGILYFRSRCKKGCQNIQPNINAPFLEANIGAALNKLYFTDLQKEELEAFSGTHGDIALMEQLRQKEVEAKDRIIAKAKEDIAYLSENKLTLLKSGVYTPDDYLHEETRLKTQIEKLSHENKIQASIGEAIEKVLELSELLKRAVFYYFLAKPAKKEQLISYVFSELSYDGKTFKSQCKKGFKALQTNFVSFCGEDAGFSELLDQYESILQSIAELKSIMPEYFN